MNPPMQIVAIDGPAGAGKSTVARRVAAELGFAFLDTGAMYRAATWWAMHQAVDLDDPDALAANTRCMQLSIEECRSGQCVVVNGQDVTDAIRTPEVTRQIFRLDQIPAVREQLVALQQAFGARQPTVAEGRDMGTVVFPQARCKIYLDASLEERTRRRARDLRQKGYDVDEAALREEIRERDEHGMKRATSPLRPAADAIHLDTSNLSQDEVVDRIVQIARERL
ncbi:MAG: (d)CMP kinase [Candidatus Hydrogenedentes bacterium]|nr:(d)CMP kinase [Candidatus Hydrogenedentota bacterium]